METFPGFLVSVHVPTEGNPEITTDPVGTVQVGWVIVPGTGAEGMATTAREYVAVAGVQGAPTGLLVVKVRFMVFPMSDEAGVYVKEKGEDVTVPGLTVPPPSSVIVSCVALPPKRLPVTVTAAVPHIVPVVDERVMDGPFTQPQATANSGPVVVHPALFRTVIV